MSLFEIFYIVLFIIIGFGTGIAAGMMGIGGGVIFVPALYFLLPIIGIDNNLLPITVISTSLLAGSFASSSSAYQHFKLKNIDLKKSLYLACGSLVSSIILPMVVVSVDAGVLKTTINIILLFVALKMLFFQNRKAETIYHLKDPSLFLFGILIGALAAFGGIGGGVILIPLLVYFSDIGMKKSIGTSSLVVAATMVATALTYIIIGAGASEQAIINYKAGIPLGAGALLGARFGARLVARYSASVLKKIFSVFLLIIVVTFFLTN